MLGADVPIGRSVSRRPATLVILMLALAACKSVTPIVSTITPTDIVRQNTVDAFDTFLTKQDAPAIQEFRARISAARTRQDLSKAWTEVPSLAARGGDFLTKHVFDKAVAEAKWPKDRPLSDFEGTFVAGVRQGSEAFLKEAQ